VLTARILARRTSFFGSLAAILIVAAVLGSSGAAQASGGRTGLQRSALAPMPVQPTVEPTVPPIVPGPLIDPSLDLRARPVDIPLELRIPSLHVNAAVVSVAHTNHGSVDVQ